MQIPQVLLGCTRIGDDIKQIELWLSIFLRPSDLGAAIGEAVALHRSDLNTEFHALYSDFNNTQWFATGKDFASLMETAIGPVPDYHPWDVSIQ